MSTPLKIIAGLLATVAVLFIALAIAVSLIVKPENYRPLIVDTVERATGRVFELQGEIGLKVFPCCAVSLGAARLGNPADFPDDDFAAFDGAALSLKLWPLLIRREVEIGTITLDGLDLNLLVLPDGRVNWEFGEDPDAADPAEPGDPGLSGLHIEGIAIRDGRLHLRDRQAALEYLASDVRVRTGAIDYRDTLVIDSPEILLSLTGTDLPGGRIELAAVLRRVEVTLDDTAAVTLEALKADLRLLDTRLRLEAGGMASAADLRLEGTLTLDRTSPRSLLEALSDDPYRPAGSDALTRLEGSARWTLGATSLAIDALDFRLDESRVTGNVAINDFDTGMVHVDLDLDRLDLDRYLPAEDPPTAGVTAVEPTTIPLDALADLNLRGRMRIGALRTAGLDFPDIALDIDSAGGPFSFSLVARLPDGHLEIDGRGDVSGGAPRLAGNVTLQDLAPRALLRALDIPIDTADPQVLATLAGTSGWQLTPDTLVLDRMRWKLDATELTGTLQIEDFDRPATRFDLTLDRLDLDAYLPPADTATAGESDPVEIPVELIRTLNLEGRLVVQQLRLFDIPLQNVSAAMRAADGVLHLEPVTAGLYGGEYRGTISIDARGAQAQATLDQSLSAVQVGELLGAFYDSDLLAGALSVQFTGAGSGNTPTELLRGLVADVDLNLRDGVYRGMDVMHELGRARALLRNETPPAEPASREMPIRALALQGRMVDGVLRSDRLSAETPFLKLGGQGGLNLVDLALDYTLNAELLRTPEDSGGRNLAELLGKSIPLTIKGPVLSPRVSVDLKNLVTTQIRSTVEQRARDALLERLTPRERETPQATDTPATPAQPQPDSGKPAPEAEPPARDPSPRDLLRRGLRDLIAPPEPQQR